MRGFALLIVLVGAALMLAGCGMKAPQDYVVTGTLDASQELRTAMRQPLFDDLRRRFNSELVMTVRTSPDVGDVVVQRRWLNVTLPHEFGLGKERGAVVETKAKEVYITAHLTLKNPQNGAPLATFVGWTKTPVPVKSYHLHLELTDMLSRVDASQDGFPTGGWMSPSVREEGVPPGLENDKERGREFRAKGAKVYAGTIDVSDPTRRGDLSRGTLFLQARTRAGRGAPELIVKYTDLVFPFSFSLHENQVFFGDPVPVEELEPKFVEAIFDRDGIVDTKNDQVRVVTSEQVKPETFDLELVLDLDGAPPAIFGAAPPRNPAPQPGAGDAPKTAAHAHGDRGAHLASGKIILPEDLAVDAKPKSSLWISLRDAASDKLIFVTSIAEPTFPQEFDLHAADNKFGGTVEIDQPFKVKAILTDGPVMQTGPGIFIGLSETISKGTGDIAVVLERSQ